MSIVGHWKSKRRFSSVVWPRAGCLSSNEREPTQGELSRLSGEGGGKEGRRGVGEREGEEDTNLGGRCGGETSEKNWWGR